jgi:hypothetical protein
MMSGQKAKNLKSLSGVLCGISGASAVVLLLGLAAFAWPRPAQALPAYAKETGVGCGGCHVNPAGGGRRTKFGNTFAANGHKVPWGLYVTPSDRARASAWSLAKPYDSHFDWSRE